MEVALKNVRLTYTLREVIILLTFIGGLVAHAIRTEVLYADVSSKLTVMQQQLADCEAKLKSVDGRHNDN